MARSARPRQETSAPRTEPVKDTWSMPGWRISASVTAWSATMSCTALRRTRGLEGLHKGAAAERRLAGVL